MIELLKKIEIGYLKCFCKCYKGENFIRFWDENLKRAFSVNVTKISEKANLKEISEIIYKEIEYKKKMESNFLLVEFQRNLTANNLKELEEKPFQVDSLYYMIINTLEYKNLKANIEYNIKELGDERDIAKFKDFYIKDSSKIIGTKLAKNKVERKIKVYKDKENNLTLFICYYNNKIVASCELFLKDNIAKIEDVGVLNYYRNRGIATTLIREVLKFAREEGAEYAYVIAQSNSSVVNMYKKLGFKNLAAKTQLIYDIF